MADTALITIRDWQTFVPFDLSKAIGEEKDGARIVHGPLASEDEDYDGEYMVRSGVKKGREMHTRLGAHVDWDHMYLPTHNPETLIGVGKHYDRADGRPLMDTHLRPEGESRYADGCWKGIGSIPMGYSLLGTAVKAQGSKHAYVTEIRYVTIAPQTKGFGQHIERGSGIGGLVTVAKAMMSGVESDIDWTDSWEEFEVPDYLAKALTTGDGIVDDLATGGQTLRTQYMPGSETPRQRRRRRRKKRLSSFAKGLAEAGIVDPERVERDIVRLLT